MQVCRSMAATPNWSSARHPFGCIMMPTPAARSVSDLSNTMLFIPFLQNTTNTYYLLIHCILNGLIASLSSVRKRSEFYEQKKINMGGSRRRRKSGEPAKSKGGGQATNTTADDNDVLFLFTNIHLLLIQEHSGLLLSSAF